MACSEFTAHGSSKLDCETCGEQWFAHARHPLSPPCNCEQSLALQRRLTVHETLLRGIREALETDSVEDDAKRVSWIAAMVKLALFNLEGLK